MPIAPGDPHALLDAARQGDEDAFARLVEPHRAELLAHCYRMLGSTHDAEDALQDALLRAWRGLGGLSAPGARRSWLYRIATNTCLDLIARRPRRVLPIEYGPPSDPHEGPGRPLVESVWVEPFPDDRLGLEDATPEARYEARESVELAFVAALQHLPARQRAVLILREVLGFSAREVAAVLETTVASVNSAMQRARAAVRDRLPERSQQAALRSLGDRGVRDLAARYADAWERGDVDAVVAMLAHDALVAMPPMPTWFAGRDGVATFLREWAFARHWSGGRFERGERRVRLLPARASGQLAFASYHRPPGGGPATPTALQVLSLGEEGITEIVGFVLPDLFPAFNLPARLE